MPDQPPEHRPGQRGMGRGLSAILPRSRADEQGLRDIPLELISPNPAQPRRDFDQEALLALAESIRSRGVLQPIVVRPLTGGRFELIAGERRLRAARLAEIATIPAVVRQTEDDERLDLALAENMARVDLNPVEEARACAMLVEDLGLTKEEVGRRVGKSRVAVSNLIRILELPDEALDLIAAGTLSEGHGRAILTEKDHARRRQLAHDARDHGWSVRETEARARGGCRAARPARRADRDPPRPVRRAGRGGGRVDGGHRLRGQGPRPRRWRPRRAGVRLAGGGDRSSGAAAAGKLERLVRGRLARVPDRRPRLARKQGRKRALHATTR